ncbi:DnaJ-like subfamily C member 2 [Lamellibrachia satsuma]|nr:DnaJ-like subfamily C member 2 [Lamellibrachia satsuma]
MRFPVIMLPEIRDDEQTIVTGQVSALSSLTVEPIGRWYEAYALRRLHKQSLSHNSLSSSSSDDDDNELSQDEDDDDDGILLTLDPKDWKNQDHYTVLGLGKQRYRATTNQIKKAYKRKVLQHHPDKRRARGVPVKEGEEDYFTCITRAWETLGIPAKRKSYDSIDPQFDDSVPSVSSDSKEKFYEVFRPYFEQNARWSVKKWVPVLGDDSISFEDVNNFYSYWYNFDSWREYSYLDEEEKEKGENRDERRWIEKQNKAARQKRKKEEIARLRQLVDNSYACDPRIARHLEQEKQKKLAAKQAKRDAARARADEEERVKREAEEAERKLKEEEEEVARIQADKVRKEKETQRKVLKKERKTLRTKLKEFDYFATVDDERVSNMQDMDKLSELLSVTSLQTLNEALTSGDTGRAKETFHAQVRTLNEELEREKQKQLELTQRGAGGRSEGGASKGAAWASDEVEVLIKAVNLFPAGTMARWETVASFITQHIPSSKRTAKEVLFKAKELQKNDGNLKEDANKKAFDRFAKDKKGGVVDTSDISERYDSVAEQQIMETGSNPAPWTADEQKHLEQALKTFPASTPERWDRISATIPTRSRRDCMRRYKELVELIRAKKAAQDAALKNKK